LTPLRGGWQDKKAAAVAPAPCRLTQHFITPQVDSPLKEDSMPKRVRVTASLPDLSASHHHQEATGEGSSLKVAIGRAVDAIFEKEHVKGRHLRGGTFRWNLEEGGKGEKAKEG
jgi:hypothetical protein